VTRRDIRIENARSHNLRDVSCCIPLHALTVVTGVSGSGKSTLAFDTLYAEGQRRYVTSLSTYARQFLERLPRPDVDAISHLPPAIAIEQRNRVSAARSTVATATEIHDHLRLLFARAGEPACPDCGLSVRENTVASVAERLAERFAGRRVTLAAPLAARAEEAPPEELRRRLLRDGYGRVLAGDGALRDLHDLDETAFAGLLAGGEGLVVVDRLALRADTPRARLGESVASGLARGGGRLVAVAEDGERATWREGLACEACQRVLPAPEPPLFSFNSPLGACPTCQGFGRVPGLDPERLVPDPERSLEEDAIAPFATPSGRGMRRDLLRAARRAGVPTDRPFRELEPGEQAWVLEGDEASGGSWYGVRGYFDWLEARRYKVQARVQIARYRRFDPCPDCGGARLRPEALAVRVAGRNLAEVTADTVSGLCAWLEGLSLPAAAAERAARVLELLRERAATVEEVGLGYLPLDRQVRTLSGGEAQRIQLASALGGSLTATLYVLDEPTVGLHPRDVDRLLAVLRGIRDLGNTVVVVEHAPEVVAAADHVIDLGPGAGRHGGRLIVEGPVDAVRRHPASATGRALRGEGERARRRPRRARGRLRIRGARAHNLCDLSVELPLGCLVVVTGVSGAGKSSLVRDVLVRHLRGEPERGDCDAVEGADAVGEVVVVDQSPASRSPRSNPATVSKAFDPIRRLFAGTREARALGAGPGWFSFNVPGGRCDRCEGAGEIVIDMQFLDDLRVPCDACDGRRYRKEVLDVRLDGRTIVDVLHLTVEAALDVFAADRAVVERLEPLARVGLGYLELGQPLSTLSGGEHQRLRLAGALAGGAAGALFVLDEPTTGLHPADVGVLLGCLEGLLDAGGSVLVVEHNLEVIRAADHVIDLGPEGGPGGGRLVAQGSPEEVAAAEDSHTGLALRGL